MFLLCLQKRGKEIDSTYYFCDNAISFANYINYISKITNN